MTVIGSPHSGLPFVPPALDGELLGAWLLRIAEIYGIGLRTLLCRLAAWPNSRKVPPPWHTLHGDSLCWESLATALRRPAEALSAMTAPRCQRYWPRELGCCVRCLAEATSALQPPAWQQAWMHPVATVCERHGTWLVAIAVKELRAVRYVHTLGDLAEQAGRRDAAPAVGSALFVSGALWLQQRLVQPTVRFFPWGHTELSVFARIVAAVARLMMSDKGAGFARMYLRGDAGPLQRGPQEWSAQEFIVEDGVLEQLRFTLPSRLVPRQILLGLIGDFLQHAPEARAAGVNLTVQMVRDLLCSSLDKWPPSAVEWISPKAATYVRHQADLRARYGLSPTYFRTRARLLRTLDRTSG